MTHKPARGTATKTAQSVPRYRSDELFRGATTAAIEHQGHSYLLRITRQGKLILTK